MKKLLILFLGILVFTSCEDLTKYDGDPYQASKVPAETLFSNGQFRLINEMTSTNVNLNIFRMLDQYWTETTYIDEANYDINTRAIPDNQWAILYRDVLKDLNEASKLTEASTDPSLTAAIKANRQACITILEVYTYEVLVDTFGDVPYTKALDFNDLLPAYDDAATIYTSLLTSIDGAIGSISTGDGGFGDADLLYGGNMGAWKKFATSLKLRLGITLADVNPTAAQAAVESASAGAFSSNADNASFGYLSAPPNTNPIWVDLVQSGRKDFVAANTIVDAMNAVSDPRRSAYFTFDAGGTTYTGGPYGDNNNYATYSHPADAITAPNFPACFMDYAEVEFYKAEAAARGWNVGGTAASHYTAGITASMEYWGVDAASVVTYLARPDVAYATATGTWQQKIGTQAWFALYNRGYEAWTEFRRLDFPALTAPSDAVSALPMRYTYPTTEQNLNPSNYAAAASHIGGDAVDTKVFWDVN